ncbi:hypothetical protein [Rhodopirellula europaea]|uniref:hypothetical protein n=1 Tax=Rhodopirellula europaea TaxID=1263866 RepID=UPI003D2DE2B0
MAPPRNQWTYDYETIANILGITVASLRSSASKGRNQLDPSDLKSVLLYIAVNGPDSLRMEILKAMIRTEDSGFASPKPMRAKQPTKRVKRMPRKE